MSPTRMARSRTHLGALTNPLLPGADPAVVYFGGSYYLIQPDRQGLAIYQAPTLGQLGRVRPTRVHQAPASGPASANLWAPELHLLDNRWYIYYAADDGLNENHRIYVLESAGLDPLGPYHFRGRLADPQTDRWAIDATILELTPKERYLIWSGWDGWENGEQRLYMAPMSSPTALAGPRVCISRPTAAWEQLSGPHPSLVNEAPALLQRHGKVYLAYSANGFWSDEYCLGLLSFQGGDPLDPRQWQKSPGPVFGKTRDAFNVGHCCFVRSPDGQEDWILYHAVSYRGSGGRHRSIRAQRLSWNPDATPHWGHPVSTHLPLHPPSGEGELSMA